MSFNAVQGISNSTSGANSPSQTMAANATDVQHFSNTLNNDNASKIPSGVQNTTPPKEAQNPISHLAQQNLQSITSGGSAHGFNNASSTGQANGNFGGNHGSSNNASSTGQANGNFGGNHGSSGDKGQVAGGNNSQIGGNHGGSNGGKDQVTGGGNSSNWQFSNSSQWQTGSSLNGKFG